MWQLCLNWGNIWHTKEISWGRTEEELETILLRNLFILKIFKGTFCHIIALQSFSFLFDCSWLSEIWAIFHSVIFLLISKLLVHRTLVNLLVIWIIWCCPAGYDRHEVLGRKHRFVSGSNTDPSILLQVVSLSTSFP